MQAIGREGCNWCPVTALGVRMRGRDRRRGKEGRRERQKERERGGESVLVFWQAWVDKVFKPFKKLLKEINTLNKEKGNIRKVKMRS